MRTRMPGSLNRFLTGRSLAVGLAALCVAGASGQGPEPVPPNAAAPLEYRLLSTSKTSTMEKEMNAAAASGFRFEAAMGGDTSFGGSEVVVIMSRGGADSAPASYRLLAANRTSTMQKELAEAGRLGFQYRAQTVFDSAFGGAEVVVILERSGEAAPALDYKLLATSKTSTLEKELATVAGAGYRLVGLTVSKTALGGNELVAITARQP